jgi:peptidyl-prolyl cis-trans isomerase B (cyclophilin B)
MAQAPRVQLCTSVGDVVIELDSARALKTAENFLGYVRDGYYDGTIFHRVIGNFMIQAGGFEPDMKSKKPRACIENEADNGLRNTLGSIAMARTSDPHSASAQFFINVSDNAFLDFKSRSSDGWGYCVFGAVVEGMEVVEKIVKSPTAGRAGHQDVPIEDIVIESARELKES